MPETRRPLKVFLCHASADKPKVRELYRTLKRRGVQPWLDAENLIPGQNWEVEIPKALLSSDAIIICLSPNSVDKEGYVQKEIKFALDKALEMPEGRIFLIPARLEDCELPFSLRQYQAVNLYEKEGYTKLMKALKLRASQLERNTVELPKEREIAPEIKQVVEEKKSVEPKQETKTLESSHEPSFQDVYVGGNKNNLSQQAIPTLVKPEEKRFETPKATAARPQPKKAKSSRKWNTAIVVAMIGAAATIIAGVLSSPLINNWSLPLPTTTKLVTETFAFITQPPVPTNTPERNSTPTKPLTSTPTTLIGNADIVFVSDVNGDSGLYYMSEDGSQQALLVKSSSEDYETPAWSPDGKQIAFIVRPSGASDIYSTTNICIMNADGSGKIILTDNAGAYNSPTWSPDGKQIAFVKRVPGESSVYIMDGHGEQLRRLVGYAISPAWSPDGKNIAFVSVIYSGIDMQTDTPIYKYIIKIMGVDGSGLISTGVEGNDPVWSPDGTQLAFVHQREIYIMNVDGSKLTQITNNRAYNQTPSWSADGRRIVFASGMYGNSESFEIFVIGIDGSGLTKLTNNSAWDGNPVWRP